MCTSVLRKNWESSNIRTKEVQMIRIESKSLGALIARLRSEGFRVLGPTVRDSAVVIDEIRSVEDLPMGWTDEQTNASYHLRQSGEPSLFGYTVGPHSWKRFLFPPSVPLITSSRSNGSLNIVDGRDSVPPPTVFFGVRPCELHAIAIQDRIFLQEPFVDPWYKSLRDRLFIVTVQCTRAGGTCFCASMKTGPRAEKGFDLSLTEVTTTGSPFFLAEGGSERGSALLAQIPGREAEQAELDEANRLLDHASASMGRTLQTDGLKQLLYDQLTHPEWDRVGQRCLACANCTLVCPTCFCSTSHDTSDLTNSEAVRTRTWDSCFNADFSYIHGGSVRTSIKGRYRQWMTHKLSSWVDQFGTFGCVGCGRCITWCPVGIDLTEEAKRVREQTPVATQTS